jgi:Bardet-Biedl syndrome 2 protein
MDELETLRRRRDSVKQEMKYLAANWKTLRGGDLDDPSLIAPDTEIACTLTPSMEEKRLLLIMNTNNETVIKSAVIYGDRVFESGCFMVTMQPNHSQKSTSNRGDDRKRIGQITANQSSMRLPLEFQKDLECTLSIKAMVGHLSSSQNHVFELSHRIPKFASYLYVPTASIRPHSHSQQHTTFILRDHRIQRLILWLNQAFLLEFEPNTKRQHTVDISFVSLRNGEYLTLQFQCDAAKHSNSNSGGSANDSRIAVKLITDNLTLCGDIVQDIAHYLAITDLHTTCCFEKEFETLRTNMERVHNFNHIRNRLSVDIASNTASIKNLLVQAQDARIQSNYDQFKQLFSECFQLNQQMLGEFNSRSSNHRLLVQALKAINQTIDKMSRLRVGKYQKITVKLARSAIKKNNVEALIHALRDVAGKP